MAKTATTVDLRPTALRYVADQAVRYLLQVGEPAKTGQITGFIGDTQPVSAKVVRDALTLDPRLLNVERRWDLAMRAIDARHTRERIIEDLLRGAGRPLSVEQLGVEIGRATDTPPEVEADTVARLVGRRPRFVSVGEGVVMPHDWLLDTAAGNPEDVLFENFDDSSEVEAARSAAGKADWKSPADAASKTVDTVGRPVTGMVLAFLAYEALGAVDPLAFHRALADAGLIWLSDGTWITPALVEKLVPVWNGIADEPPVEGAPEEAGRPAGSIAVTPVDLEEVTAILRRAEGFVTSRQLLEQVFEVGPQERDYEKWEAVLAAEIEKLGEYVNVGWDRWRRIETLPVDILDMPDELSFQPTSFQTIEGEELDVILEDEGFEGSLKDLVAGPIASMGGECRRMKDGSARCAVTHLLRGSGALPIGGKDRYFAEDPLVQEATIVGPDGRFSLWINNGLGLAFGLKSIYEKLPEHGGVFLLKPGARPGEYTLEITPETDPVLGIDDTRLKELHAIAARPNFKSTSTFELLQELLERHRKGADFLTLLAELWVIRDVDPRQVASILSAYHAFKQSKSGAWTVDVRDVDKGLKKPKRKYMK